VVTKGQFHIGDVLPLGSPVFEIARQDGYCFEASIASQDMGLVHDAMPARVKLDAYDYQLYGTLSGPVCFISPDTSHRGEADTTYCVRVALLSDRIGQGEYWGDVKLGMAGQLEILTDRRTVLSILIRRIRTSISFG
jgi:adhesin transport system membrane fusion protein